MCRAAVGLLLLTAAAATDSAKVGILLASLFAGGIGFTVLRTASSLEVPAEADGATTEAPPVVPPAPIPT